MITDARALRTQFVPRELQHREGAIERLSSALQPITRGDPAEDVFLSGPPGTGKTTTAKYVAQRLERQTEAYHWGYVNCLSRSSRAQVLWKLARDAGVGRDLRPEGHSPARFLDRLEGMESPFVALIDEVNVLQDPETLIELHASSQVSLVLLCVDEDGFYAACDSRLLSRLRGAVKVHLEPYSDTQLADILRNRVEHGLVSGVVDSSVIERIATVAAGDARHGIVLLRLAVLRARDRGADAVSLQDVEAVTDAAHSHIEQRYLSSLGTDLRLLFEVIRDEGSIQATRLREVYEHRASDPVADSTRGKYLQQLQELGLIEAEGHGKGRTYRVAGTGVGAAPM